MSSDSLYMGAGGIVILSCQTFWTECFGAIMLLLALSSLCYFNYTIWDIVIHGIFT